MCRHGEISSPPSVEETVDELVLTYEGSHEPSDRVESTRPISWWRRCRALLPTTAGTYVIAQRMDVPPAGALAVCRQLWQEPLSVDAGTLDPKCSRRSSRRAAILDHKLGVLRSGRGRRVVRVEVDLMAWSGTKSQLLLRPRRHRWPPITGRREKRYFSIGRAVLEHLGVEIERAAGFNSVR
jgi:hypothetical protein